MDVLCYGRWSRSFHTDLDIDHVAFLGPDGTEEVTPVFYHQPAVLEYDVHGYETLTAKGRPVLAVRYTPDQTGCYAWKAMSGDRIIQQDTFICTPSKAHGYVEVSKRDPRYFAYTDGTGYCPIGLNLCWPKSYRLPTGGGHFSTTHQTASMGILEYKRWMTKLKENGGNFIRIWLSNGYFEVEGETAGELDAAAFNKLDALVEIARELNIKLKLCFEHFRTVAPDTVFSKMLRHPKDGTSPKDMREWFTLDKWQDLWQVKLDAYLARYGNDPVVMAWELWNEINCCETGDWAIQRDWTQRTLRRIKKVVPRQMVVNSLGSFDHEVMMEAYQDFANMEEMDFQQVHRYLDQGASLEVCRMDPPEFSVDAIRKAGCPNKPVLLAETGGVNDHHTGPFRYYRWDNRGVIFHDTTFPPFFAGAAGTGQIWHWDEYVDEKNLWQGFSVFNRMLEGLVLDQETFETVDLSTDQVWFYGLKGKHTMLCWIRNKADTWYHVYRDEREPEIRCGLRFQIGIQEGRVLTLEPWQKSAREAILVDGSLLLPDFQYGLVVRVDYL